MSRDGARDVVEGMVGAAGMALAFLTPMLRGLRSEWGLSDELAQREYPGDELVPEPRWSWTHGIEIDAPQSAVWPWVAQIGQARAGFYSYQWLENLAGCEIENADEIVSEWQDPRVGDEIRVHPEADPLRIAVVQPGACFCVHWAHDFETGKAWSGEKPEHFINLSWLFMVEPIDDARCRFISRSRTDHSDELATRLRFGQALVEPVGFVMDRKMLLGVKQRAEAAHRG